MYATHQTFAHKWAERVERSRGPKVGYRSLPVRKRAPGARSAR